MNKHVKGIYYGQPFTGYIKDNDESNIYVELTKEIVDIKTGRFIDKTPRSSLFLQGWKDGVEFDWGYCKVVE